MCKYLEVNTL